MLEKVTEALIDVCEEKIRQGQWAIWGQIANPK
jgi:hypothetical protein